ncbi:hypothetical protein BL254_10410 [Protofrankia sp. BMG5.30]|uniref:Uncharacterized protein n=2 Tax=Frankiaceae TaxID=74712 RepID=A0ABR5F4F2_9ACTN|nr:hypothetical protein FrCorBMG51_11015 [Protofrankia coriariae]ONH35696.1 hypothetical protein BL254_10410 [Protofrankia sp. BMG5.30]
MTAHTLGETQARVAMDKVAALQQALEQARKDIGAVGHPQWFSSERERLTSRVQERIDIALGRKLPTSTQGKS